MFDSLSLLHCIACCLLDAVMISWNHSWARNIHHHFTATTTSSTSTMVTFLWTDSSHLNMKRIVFFLFQWTISFFVLQRLELPPFWGRTTPYTPIYFLFSSYSPAISYCLSISPFFHIANVYLNSTAFRVNSQKLTKTTKRCFFQHSCIDIFIFY